jgi:hypothetical protein
VFTQDEALIIIVVVIINIIVHVYLAAFLIYFISVDVILLASLALIVEFPLTYDKARRAGVFAYFNLVFFKVLCGLCPLLV